MSARPIRRRFFVALALFPGAVGVVAGDALRAQDAGSPSRIVVIDASSPFGGDVVDALLERGVRFDELILVTRTPEDLEAYATRGAEVRAADFERSTALETAFAGGRGLFLASAEEGGVAAKNTLAIAAARAAGIRHIVYASLINATSDNPAPVAREYRLTEDALARSTVPVTVLRNQLFMDDLVDTAATAIATGDLFTNAGRARWAPITRRDAAAVAAVVLTTPGHQGRLYHITGPELLNVQDFGKLIVEVTGRRVRVIETTDAVFVEQALRRGTPKAAAQADASLGAAIRANALNIRNEAAEILLGRKPQSLRELLRENEPQLLSAPAPALR